MRFVIDMNLGPHWIACLESEGHEAVHWSSVGAGDAPDDDILRWARENDRTILTADLDFGANPWRPALEDLADFAVARTA